MVMDICDGCVTDKVECVNCKNAPQYRDYPRTSKYMAYKPLCPRGFTDCVNDPAYIKYVNPKWYRELYGDKTPEEVVKENCTEERCYYDDEDK